MKECDILGGHNITLTPPTYFQWVKTSQPSGSTPLLRGGNDDDDDDDDGDKGKDKGAYT